MKSYSTIMYALDLSQSEFWLGEVNNEGQITGFTNFILGQTAPQLLVTDNMFYYVQVQDNDGELDVHVVQWYMAVSKVGPVAHLSIVSMVENGYIDPIEYANRLLAMHRKVKLN